MILFNFFYVPAAGCPACCSQYFITCCTVENFLCFTEMFAFYPYATVVAKKNEYPVFINSRFGKK
jgi:hypothetical protein